MTYEEALKELKHEIDMLPNEPPSDFVGNENVWFKEHEKIIDAHNKAIEAIEKQVPKKPIFIEEKYPTHKWQLDEHGEIDFMAAENDYHNGPICERCYTSFCVNCERDIEKRLNEQCDCSHFICPNCKKHVDKFANNNKYCKHCAQALDWSE